MDAVLVVNGLDSIRTAIRVIRGGQVPMFWTRTQVMLSGGIGAVMVVLGLGHFFFFGV
jgi:hypothetical protein